MSKFCRSQEGFTLVELLVALAILGLVLVALGGLFTEGYAGAFQAGTKSAATAMAQEKMERLITAGCPRGPGGAAMVSEALGVHGPAGGGAWSGCLKKDCEGCFRGEEEGLQWTACIHGETLWAKAPGGEAFEVPGCLLRVRVFYQEGKDPLSFTAFVRGEGH